MIKSGLSYIVFFLTFTIFVLLSFDAYSAPNSNNKEATINLINLSKKDTSRFLFPFLPSYGYVFDKNYLQAGNIPNPFIGTINFYAGANVIDNKNFYRLSSNAFDATGKPFSIDWDISTGLFFNNRKKHAFKFTSNMVFDAQDDDINTVFTKKLMESNSIINVSPIYSISNETEKIDGYEFNYTIQRSSTYRAVRTSTQILLTVGAGMANYYAMKYTNMDDWVYHYTWEDAKRRVKDGWVWDPNDFNTNTLYHLYAGAAYYMIARSNDYSIFASFWWSFAGSFVWEFFGEWREQVSLNDMILTPTLGALTGEFLIQTANYIEKSMKPSFYRETILFVVNPFDWINRRIDSTNSGDMRVRILFASPVQTALTSKIEKDVFNR